jgi:biopolymer transport protein ExbB/TolQ
MAVGGLTTGQGRGNRITTNRLHPLRQGTDTHTMTTILGVTATLLLLANILQAVAAISNKGKVQDTLLELHHAYKDLSKAIAERDRAKAEAKQADRLRDECEKTMRAAMEENDRMMTERANLYYRNTKGQIAKLHP